MYTMIWLGLMILFLIVEAATLGLTTLWFAGGSLVACFMAMLRAPVVVQIIVFLVVSIVLLIFTRPLAVRYLNGRRVKTNVETIIGTEAVVCTEINNLQAQGQVMLNGIEWTARSTDGQIIESGAVVVVEKIEGVKAIVRRK